MSEFEQTCETPRVIKNLKKEYNINKSIAIDELKVALKKARRDLFPSEMVDVFEEFVAGLELDDVTLQYENFRVATDTDGFISNVTTEVVGEPRPLPQPEQPLQSAAVPPPAP